MTSDEFKEIEDAFQKATAMTAPERAAFLERLALENAVLAQKVRDILAADSDGDTSLAAPIAGSIESAIDDIGKPWINRTIDAWTLKEKIGAGGMGAVFLAERTTGEFAQTAAIKIMMAQLVDETAERRFRAERQILANLSHPNIATLLDGGSTMEGLPYIVMEYVEGVRIDAYCDERRLSLTERLRLFQEVCNAVDYAHRNLVVHRDLKPSNILVTPQGISKLLDFGIAKLLEPGAYEITIAQTRDGARAMTPDYASPEQVRGEPVSIATDVYSLGVLLFRLLTGQSPYGSSASTSREIESAILESAPLRPSAALTSLSSDSPAASSEVGEQRSISAERLGRRLKGDLDTIALKCLQKDPERRYTSAREIAADIERFLSNEPILARADSWFYKTRKYVMRHSRALAAAAAVFATIAALVTFYTIRLADERDKAQLAAEKSSQISSFLIDVFKNADPHTAKGEEVTAIDLLDEGAKRIATLENQPIVQSELMQIIGDTYTNLDKEERAIELIQSAINIRRANGAFDPLSMADLYHDLGEAQRLSGKIADAVASYKLALKLRQENLPENHPDVIWTLERIGVTYFDERSNEEALDYLQRARNLAIGLDGDKEEDSLSLDILGNIGIVLDVMGRYKEAEPILRKTVEISEKLDGELDPNTIIRNNNLGYLLVRLYKYKEAEKIFSISVERAIKVWPKNHSQIARYIADRGAVLYRLGRMKEAEAAYVKAAEMVRDGDGESSNDYIDHLRGLGAFYTIAGQYRKAELNLMHARKLTVELFGNDNYQIPQIDIIRAKAKNMQEDGARAATILQNALLMRKKITANRLVIAERELGVALSLQGKYNAAEKQLAKVLLEQEKARGADNPALIDVLRERAANLRRAGSPGKAAPSAKRAYEIATQYLPKDNWQIALAAAEYAHTMEIAGDTEEARRIANKARRDLVVVFGEGDQRVESIDAFLTLMH
ncbi:MAG: serine/threonine-protein kinase [Parvularculaceae bacterium]